MTEDVINVDVINNETITDKHKEVEGGVKAAHCEDIDMAHNDNKQSLDQRCDYEDDMCDVQEDEHDRNEQLVHMCKEHKDNIHNDSRNRSYTKFVLDPRGVSDPQQGKTFILGLTDDLILNMNVDTAAVNVTTSANHNFDSLRDTIFTCTRDTLN